MDAATGFSWAGMSSLESGSVSVNVSDEKDKCSSTDCAFEMQQIDIMAALKAKNTNFRRALSKLALIVLTCSMVGYSIQLMHSFYIFMFSGSQIG
jgi:hypothetical protein